MDSQYSVEITKNTLTEKKMALNSQILSILVYIIDVIFLYIIIIVVHILGDV